MKIAAFEMSKNDESVFREMLPGHEILFFDETLNEENASKAIGCEAVSVFVNSQVSAAVIDALPSLKFLTTRSTGFDHIDVAHAKAKGVVVSTVPGYGSRTVAEFTFALILTLSRNIFKARLQLLEGGPFSYRDMDGFDLYGKTLGVIGTGRIGKNVIHVAKAFGMNVVAYDPFPDAAYAQSEGYTYVSLEELLGTSDIVTLHVPASKDTRHLINANNIGRIKKGALLINTARGDLVETGAMVQALESGLLGGIGLDVLEEERVMREETAMLGKEGEPMSEYKTPYENHVLLRHPRVIVTPHIAFCTHEAIREILQTTAANSEAFAKGSPQNVVA